MSEIYKQLAAGFEEEAIQQAPGKKTGKKYDMTGVGYQWCADRFNEVLGPFGWDLEYDVIDRREGKSQKGWGFFEITVNCKITLRGVGDSARDVVRNAPGGHRSDNVPDAMKGAMTNAFKKCAAFFGVGGGAYRGQLDPDYQNPDTGAGGTYGTPKKLQNEEAARKGQLEELRKLFARLRDLAGKPAAEKLLELPPNDMNVSELKLACRSFRKAIDTAEKEKKRESEGAGGPSAGSEDRGPPPSERDGYSDAPDEFEKSLDEF